MKNARVCTKVITAGRLKKAIQFLRAAEILEGEPQLADAFVTLCVQAGIASADVICCLLLGLHSVGENHARSVELLRSVLPNAAAELAQLLDMKSRSSYSEHGMDSLARSAAFSAATNLTRTASAM